MNVLLAMGPYVTISFILGSHNNTNIYTLFPQGFVLIFASRLKPQPVTQIRLHCSFCCFAILLLNFSYVCEG